MILLTFISAAKYVLSLMLAFLGIIPYEEVKSPASEPEEPVEEVRPMIQQPLERMNSLTFQGDLFSAPGDVPETENNYIPLRDEQSNDPVFFSECKFIESNCKAGVEYRIELKEATDLAKKYIFVRTGEVKPLTVENVYVISSGI